MGNSVYGGARVQDIVCSRRKNRLQFPIYNRPSRRAASKEDFKLASNEARQPSTLPPQSKMQCNSARNRLLMPFIEVHNTSLPPPSRIHTRPLIRLIKVPTAVNEEPRTQAEMRLHKR